jgi:hypothetical protein
VVDSLTNLLARRFHGAGNIYGIRYQLKYSLLRAFDAYVAGAASVRFEGIEDVDILGVNIGSEYAQAKASGTPWHWKKLRQPIESFLSVLETDPTASFTLTTSFPLKKELGQLSQLSTLTPSQRDCIEEKFIALCSGLGADDATARLLLGRLRLVHVAA